MIFFRKYVVFCLSAFAHAQMKVVRDIYDCGACIGRNDTVGKIKELIQDTREDKAKSEIVTIAFGGS